ncbi:MAG: hypothetical protein KC609_10525 [Myxococcales bacterium]|nr:hypothetical protein [Myxococcales bacterium]
MTQRDAAPTIYVASVPTSFPEALRRDASHAIDLARARTQHTGYCDTLRRTGASVIEISTATGQPDGVFIEDNALIIGRRAALLRSAAPSRQGEEQRLVAPLRAAGLSLALAPPDVIVDGGDCLVSARELIVGRSARTNARAVEWLSQVFAPFPVRSVAVPDSLLHLKSGASDLGDGRLLLDPLFRDRAEEFAGYDAWYVTPDERPAANCRRIGAHLIIAAGYPRTAALLAQTGLTIEPVEISEFAKADGSISCLSLVPHLETA